MGDGGVHGVGGQPPAVGASPPDSLGQREGKPSVGSASGRLVTQVHIERDAKVGATDDSAKQTTTAKTASLWSRFWAAVKNFFSCSRSSRGIHPTPARATSSPAALAALHGPGVSGKKGASKTGAIDAPKTGAPLSQEGEKQQAIERLRKGLVGLPAEEIEGAKKHLNPPNLMELLKFPFAGKFLKDWAIAEKNSENIEFFIAVTEFKSLYDSKPVDLGAIKAKFEQIQKDFVLPGEKNKEVNINYSERLALTSMTPDKLGATIFDKAVANITRLTLENFQQRGALAALEKTIQSAKI